MKKFFYQVFLLIFSTLCLTNLLYCYQLVTIVDVSNTEKTLLVRLGLDQGVDEGMEATFTSDNLSFIGRAIVVTKEFSTWKILEPGGKIPFEKNQIVTFNFATEKIWMFDPNNFPTYKLKKQEDVKKEEIELRQRRTRDYFPNLLSFRSSVSHGINNTTSVTTSSLTLSRQIKTFELLYGYTFPGQLQLHVAPRYEQEVTVATNASIITTRYLFTVGLNYYYRPVASWYSFYHYIGTNLGYGKSFSIVGTSKMSGESFLFPALQTGLEYISPIGLGIGGELSLESYYSREWFSNNYRLDNSETNVRFLFSICYLF